AALRRLLGRVSPVPSLHPAIGGLMVLGLVTFAGREHLGLSLELRDAALLGDLEAFGFPMWKLLLTIICIGSGFIGGEVTPLFVIGSTLGAAMAGAVGADPALGASVGLGAV